MTINIIFFSENGGKQFVALLHVVALFLQEITANSGTDYCYKTEIPYYL